jgi:hypothetical protein
MHERLGNPAEPAHLFEFICGLCFIIKNRAFQLGGDGRSCKDCLGEEVAALPAPIELVAA